MRASAQPRYHGPSGARNRSAEPQSSGAPRLSPCRASRRPGPGGSTGAHHRATPRTDAGRSAAPGGAPRRAPRRAPAHLRAGCQRPPPWQPLLPPPLPPVSAPATSSMRTPSMAPAPPLSGAAASGPGPGRSAAAGAGHDRDAQTFLADRVRRGAGLRPGGPCPASRRTGRSGRIPGTCRRRRSGSPDGVERAAQGAACRRSGPLDARHRAPHLRFGGGGLYSRPSLLENRTRTTL